MIITCWAACIYDLQPRPLQHFSFPHGWRWKRPSCKCVLLCQYKTRLGVVNKLVLLRAGRSVSHLKQSMGKQASHITTYHILLLHLCLTVSGRSVNTLMSNHCRENSDTKWQEKGMKNSCQLCNWPLRTVCAQCVSIVSAFSFNKLFNHRREKWHFCCRNKIDNTTLQENTLC